MVKEVITEEDGSQKILYGDTDGKLMYISCTGFKTEEEAIAESGEIMNKRDFYTEALTVAEYVAQIGY